MDCLRVKPSKPNIVLTDVRRRRIEESPRTPSVLPRKEVIQPLVLERLPCYDFTPIISSAFDGWLLTVTSPASGVSDSHSVTGGVYKARERIHRGMLTRDY